MSFGKKNKQLLEKQPSTTNSLHPRTVQAS